MAFASGSNHGLRYIKEQAFGVTPENPDMRALRHTSCSLVLNKDSFQSNELRRDAQISDLRHGVKQGSGDIGIEFSYGEFDDLLAAAVRSEWVDDVLKAGVNVPTFTFERVFDDIKQYQVFTGCAVNTFSLDIQSNAMMTGTIGIVGKGVDFSDKETAASETPSLTYSSLDGFHGELKEGGVPISVITSISINIENNIEAANVLGSDEAAALVPGRINITGSVSAYFENMDLLNKFVNETESEIEIALGNGKPGSYKLILPRIKYSGGTNSVDGEGPIMLDMPFQALLDECTGTNIIVERIPANDAAEPCVLDYSGDALNESATTSGTFDEVITATLSGGNGKTFSGQTGVALPGISVEGLPEGLELEVIRKSDTTADICLKGRATAHAPADSTQITVTFAAKAFNKGFCHCDGDNVQNGEKSIQLTFNDLADETPPTLQESSPANGATDIAVDAPIVLTFPEAIQAGTGNITITNNLDSTRTIHVVATKKRSASDGTATIADNTLTIALAQPLSYSTEYELTMPEGVITDLAGNPFPGIAAGELKFTTAAAPDEEAPKLTYSLPSDNQTAVAINTGIILNFSENVKAGTGDMTVSDGADDTRTIPVANATITNAKLTAQLDSDLANGKEYTVTVPEGFVADEAGNAFAGCTFKFTTKAAAPDIGEAEVDPEW